ncbi:response regulator [Rhizobium arenae]|uniref:response regulator n=1 Tax=Pararhizobium arenae TaxID=1856850 RepID=UPI000AD091E8
MNSERFLALFAGKRILIVEDEYFLADETHKKLLQLNARVVGPSASVADALELIESEMIDGAILDIHLGDELVFPVAEKLGVLSIPFVFATAYDPSIIPKQFSGFLLCEKPTELGKIAQALFDPIPERLQ